MRKIIAIILAAALLTVVLSGCGNHNDTVQNCIISNMSYASKEDMDSAIQPEVLSANETVYTSVYFIESPKGMEYTVKWYHNDTEIMSETKATIHDKRDVLVYTLDKEGVEAGTLKVEIIYKDTVLFEKELEIQ